MANKLTKLVFGRHKHRLARFTETPTKTDVVVRDWPILLSTYRSSLKLTQAQHAEMLAVSLRAVQSWEQGKRSPSVDVAERIVKLCCLK